MHVLWFLLVEKKVSDELKEALVIGISATALFDLTESDKYFKQQQASNPDQAIELYREYMFARENDLLEAGTGMPLVEVLLGLNRFAPTGAPLIDVVVLSRNSSETGLRVGYNIKKRGLGIIRSIYSSGDSVVPYLEPFNVDLFLTTSVEDAQSVIDSKLCAAAVLQPKPVQAETFHKDEVRIAFDGDAVLFDDSSELVYKTSKLEAFIEHEKANELVPLAEGPYAVFIKKLGVLQSRLADLGMGTCVKTALITARSAPAERRVQNTLRSWGVNIDTVCFLGGRPKSGFIRAFKPHIFFDDQILHLEEASKYIPSGRVPYSSDSKLNSIIKED